MTSQNAMQEFAKAFPHTIFKECFSHLHFAGRVPLPAIVFEVHDGPNTVAWASIDQHNYLWNLCVRADYRNLGVATRLLDYIKRRIRPLYLFVDTYPSESLVTFYIRNGFRIIAEHDMPLVSSAYETIENKRYELQYL